MEATHFGHGRPILFLAKTITTLTLAALSSACGQGGANSINRSSLNGQDCSAQVKADSFIVQWKTRVPAEFENYRLGQLSLTTRFSEVSQTFVEAEVLAKHAGEFTVAEHEFYINAIKDNDVSVAANAATVADTTAAAAAVANGTSAPKVTNAWGPQDIQVAEAWAYLGQKGDGVTVAVVDSGIDVNHPLLNRALWTNSGEIPNNQIDDDKNGLIDDYYGYDFTNSTALPSDGAGHGTHVSGIIAGQAGANNFIGVAPNAKIMAAKFIVADGSGAVGDAISAIDYATSHGAQIINASWGGSQCSDALKNDIISTIQHGTVFIAAAGNDGFDVNFRPEWPAAFQLSGKITVAAYSSLNVLSLFSNYGVLVDLAAPGESILSTVPPSKGQPEGQMAVKNGTSMATPFVSGVAALLLSAKPDASPQQIVDAINNSITVGNFGVRTSGKLNALKAAQYLMSH